MAAFPVPSRTPARRAPPEEPVPQIRPFRALRFRPEAVGDVSTVISPPYDVIAPDEHRRLLELSPRNVVRLDLPATEPGDAPDDRYRRAARVLAEWRSDGTLAKDPRPSLYAYEQRYTVPGGDEVRTQRGFFGRVRLESFGPAGGILPHERTLAAPREDRYRLLKATGVNTSPVVGLFADRAGSSREVLDAISGDVPQIDVVDPDRTRHRVWVIPDDGEDEGSVERLRAAVADGPITIADGHHRYETALRYRDERRMSRSCEEDPAFDYVLMLLLDAVHQPLTVLPTHRVARGIGEDGVGRLCAGLRELFEARPASGAELVSAFSPATPGGDQPQFGLWTRAGGSVLTARPRAFDALPIEGGEAVRRLGVTVVGSALEQLAGIDRTAIADGRLGFTRSAAEAIAAVDGGVEAADVAFLLQATPVADVLEVAAQGDVMPQKSTYFHPKAASGLVINPLEW
ncbi:MAG TPA: DUF1015 domain-containing protein [Candidatus Limnocylindrales bacterium]